MSIMTPSPTFAKYVQDAVSDELTKPHPVPVDVMKTRLWAAAQHDVYTKNGAICTMVDDGGLARVACGEYAQIIDDGLERLAEWGGVDYPARS